MARGRANSVSSNPQFRINWRDVTSVSQDITTGMTEEESAKAARSEKPLFVYIHDVDSEKADEDDKVFTDERVAVGARFFDCVRVSKADAAEDRLLKPFAAKAPILVFLRPNYEVAGSHQARFNAAKVFEAMSATVRKDYTNSIEAVLKQQRDIEKGRADLQRDRDRLAKLEEDGGSRAKAAELKDQVGKAESALLAREETLYKLEPKEEAKTS